MFWIFKIFPDWFWWLLLLTGIFSFLASYLAPLKPYQVLLKNCGLATTAVAIFILGMLHADNAWKQAAQELQAKVLELEAKSQQVNTVIQEKLVNRTQVVKVRGNDVVQYIDREVVKTNAGCVVSSEFVSAHNRAAEPPK